MVIWVGHDPSMGLKCACVIRPPEEMSFPQVVTISSTQATEWTSLDQTRAQPTYRKEPRCLAKLSLDEQDAWEISATVVCQLRFLLFVM